MSDQREPSARRFAQPHARGGVATAQVAVFIASATLFAVGAAGCVSRERMNAACTWTGDPPRALDLRRAADRRHLDRDAETAEELAIRYTDASRGHRSGHFAGDAEYAGARERCMEALVGAAAAAHGVERRDVVDAIGRRPPGVDLAVLLSFACAYVAAVRFVTRRLVRRFPADEPAPAAAATIAATIFASACATMLFVLWSNGVEIARLGDGHMSYRVGRLPSSRHGIAIYVAAAVLFLLIALTSYARSWKDAAPRGPHSS